MGTATGRAGLTIGANWSNRANRANWSNRAAQSIETTVPRTEHGPRATEGFAAPRAAGAEIPGAHMHRLPSRAVTSLARAAFGLHGGVHVPPQQMRGQPAHGG